MTIGFIGGGIMAEAIIRGVLNQKNISASDFLISELVESRRNFLKDTYKINENFYPPKIQCPSNFKKCYCLN